jgi:DNA-binding response OmpR family regulator
VFLRYDELLIDARSRVVMYGPMRVELRRREYALLAFLAATPSAYGHATNSCATCGATARTA